MTATECKSDFKLTTDTPYLTLTGELWGVYYENFEENPPRNNCTALYWIQHCILHQVALLDCNAHGGKPVVSASSSTWN